MTKFKSLLSSLLIMMLLTGIIPSVVLAEAAVQLQSLFVNQQFTFVDLYGLSDTGLAWVEQDNKFGFIDRSGQVVIPMQYDRAYSFSEGLAAVMKDKMCGYINTKGDVIIPNKYTFADDFNNGIAQVGVRTDGKTLFGYINKNGEEVIPLKYTNIYPQPTNGYSIGSIYDTSTNTGSYYLINTSGLSIKIEGRSATLVDGKYVKAMNDSGECTYYDLSGNKLNFDGNKYGTVSNDLMAVSKDGKYGYVDSTGATVIPFEFASAYSFDSNGVAIVSKEKENVYAIDKAGNTVINPDNYTGIRPFSVYSNPDNKNFFVVTKYDENRKTKQGCVDYQGNVVIPAIYDWIGSNQGFSDGLISVKTNNKYGFADKNGNLVIPAIYDAIGKLNNGNVAVKKDDKWGVINKDGSTVIPFEYDEIGVEGLINSLAVVQKDGKCGAIDTAGNTVIPFEYESVRDIYITPDGLIWTVKYNDDTYVNNNYSLYAINKVAEPTQSSVLVDGEKVSLEAFNIDGSNYFKLRDIATVLNGTKKQFAVGWDNSANSITITTGKGYTTVGGELVLSGNADNEPASLTDSKILLNGTQLEVTAYNINGSNYFKLRDLASSIDFGLTWNESANTIGIETGSSYTK